MSLETLSGATGIAAGAAAGGIWCFASGRLREQELWPRLQALTRALISSDAEDPFARQYIRVLPVLMRYVGKQLIVLLLACAPVVAAYVALELGATRVMRRNVSHVEVAPRQSMTVTIAGKTLRLDESTGKIPNSVDLDALAVLSTNAGEFRCDTLMRKQAYSDDPAQRLLLALLGFKILRPEKPRAHAERQTLLLQPSCGDGNFLWPYLADWECGFLMAVSLASIGGMLFLKARKR